ncbi:MAG: (2Fe-2S)-binding protein [Rhodothermales bacterium]
MQIDRCVCFQVRFSELKKVALKTGAGTIEELQQEVDFGLRCKLCHPYVNRMLRTGETVFSEIISDEQIGE